MLEESLALSSFQLLRLLRNDKRELSTSKLLCPNPYFDKLSIKKGVNLFCFINFRFKTKERLSSELFA